MNGAIHGDWCGARTLPTRCRYCSQDVYYFSCNCGSKVFFSELGDPWPLHRCVPGLTAMYGREFVEYGMAMQMKQHVASKLKSPIEKRYEDVVKGQLAKRKSSGDAWIQRISASAGSDFEDAATLKEIDMKVDVARRLKVAGSGMASAFLGVLGKKDHGQVTLHAGGLEAAKAESYTAFIPSDLLIKLKASRGDLVHARLKAVQAGKEWVWVVRRIEFLVH